MTQRTAIIIPARYGSTRFPGKVLAPLGGKPIIQWVYEKALASKADSVAIAVDDARVAEVVERFGGHAIMTAEAHPTGTDRIHEAAQQIEADIIINVQGDEPLIPSSVIDELIDTMGADSSIEMGTVAVPCKRNDVENNPNIVKVVMDKQDFALYFSRSMIPFLRTGGRDMEVFRHWGIYAYRRQTLERLVTLPEGELEKCEMLEQLRALQNGIRIRVIKSQLQTIGIDTPEDLEQAEQQLARIH